MKPRVAEPDEMRAQASAILQGACCPVLNDL
jgi:hypothetical protein